MLESSFRHYLLPFSFVKYKKNAKKKNYNKPLYTSQCVLAPAYVFIFYFSDIVNVHVNKPLNANTLNTGATRMDFLYFFFSLEFRNALSTRWLIFRMQINTDFRDCQHVIYIRDKAKVNFKWIINDPLLSEFINVKEEEILTNSQKRPEKKKKTHLKIFNFKARDAEFID